MNVVFEIIGLCISIASTLSLAIWMHRLRRCKILTGTIVDLADVDFGDIVGKFPIIEFIDVHGHNVEIHSKIGSGPSQWCIGQKIKVATNGITHEPYLPTLSISKYVTLFLIGFTLIIYGLSAS